jgi:hypothetical protein
MGLQAHWSLNAGANQTSDPTINMREGQAPSTLNDGIRQIMAKAKAFAIDVSGILETTGTQPAYELDTEENFTALTDGTVLAFRPHATNTGAPTLAVALVAAKPIQSSPSVAAAAGALPAGKMCRVLYLAAQDAFLLLAVGGVLDASVGTRTTFLQAAAPLGWMKETNPLYDDAAMRIVTSSGGGTGGTAGFAATFTSRTISQVNLSNVNFAGSAAAAGSHSHGGATGDVGTHTHFTAAAAVTSPGALLDAGNAISRTTNSDGESQYILRSGGAASVGLTSAAGQHAHTIPPDGNHGHSVSVSSGRSGTPLDFAVKFANAIVCVKA